MCVCECVVCDEDLVLNNLHWLICHKTKRTMQSILILSIILRYVLA